MSLRALGRQFAAHARDAVAGRHYWAGTESHPQGALFIGGGGKQPIFDAQFKEASRRRMAGENNPSHAWDPPMLQHHFPGYDPQTGKPRFHPVEQELF